MTGLALITGLSLLYGQGGPTLYGDFRSASALAFMADDSIAAATRGGLAVVRSDGSLETFGWNGLINGRGLDDIWFSDGRLHASSGELVAEWNGLRFTIDPEAKPRVRQPVSAGGGSFDIPPRPVWPESPSGVLGPSPTIRGTHVSAVTGDAGRLVAAWYGDGLWNHDGKAWTSLGPQPDAFRHVRALGSHAGQLAVATQDGAIWRQASGAWRQATPPNAPEGSVYGLATFGGRVFGSTFEHGLSVFDGKRWTSRLTFPSASPREIVGFKAGLYLRDTFGKLHRYDGKTWADDVARWLPRGEATTLAVGDGKLLVGQFGGWSEFDGSKWSHFLKLPALQGVVVTALAARPGEVWAGTQGKGLIRYDRRTGLTETFDQRHGLGDDWVRRILADRRGVVVGLFLKGAFVRKGAAFERLTPEVPGEATGLARDHSGKLYVASRIGLWRIERSGATRVTIAGIEDLEIQAALPTSKGLWLGLPFGTAFAPWPTVR